MTKVFPGGTVAVEDVNLVAPAGRTTVIVGPPGSGKSVLLRMVNRMIDPSSGRVNIDGNPNTSVRRSTLRRGIGYVISGGLFPHRTVIRNIETVPLLLGSDRAAARRIAAGLMERVGLPEIFAQKYPAQLSPGQQARVALARALAADPPILLMDSPFSALEPAVRQDIQDDLLELQRVSPKTILFATHDIDEAIKLGDQIAVLGNGRLAQLATPMAMLAQPGSDYVADLLGRDRGIRKLTFLPASDLPLTPAATVQAGATGSRAKAIAETFAERWLLVLDSERRPRGWVDTIGLAPDAIVAGPIVHPLGGSFYADESVLAALDAAILSAAGLAVCLDDDGTPLGVINHAEIARHLAAVPPGTSAGIVMRSGAGAESTAAVFPPVAQPTYTPPPAMEQVAPPEPAAYQPAAYEPAKYEPAPEPPAYVAPPEREATPRQAMPEPMPQRPPARPSGPTEPRPDQSTPFGSPPDSEPMGTTWTTRQEPGPQARVVAPAARRPPDVQPAPAVKDLGRQIPVVPKPAPAQGPRSGPPRPPTVPTVRASEPAQSGRPTNGALDPVSRWLIGAGEDDDAAARTDSDARASESRAAEPPSPGPGPAIPDGTTNGTANGAANGATNGTASGMSNVATSARGDATWEWDSGLGQWVDVSDRSSDPRRRGAGGSGAGEAGR